MAIRTLLYIDPDAGSRLLLRKALGPQFVVYEAQNAWEGSQAAERMRPDLILVDVDLVKVAELLPALRRSAGLASIPLVAATAHAWPEHLAATRAAGFARVLLKPLDIDVLRQDLEGCLLPPARPGPMPLADRRGAVHGVDGGQNGGPTTVAPAEPVRSWPDEVGEGAPGDSGAADGGPGQAEGTTAAPPAVAGDGEPGTDPGVEADVGGVPAHWRLSLPAAAATLARCVPGAGATLALLDETGDGLVVVAAHGHGQTDDASLPGARVPLSRVGWVRPQLEGDGPALVESGALGPSPLIPPGSRLALVLPLATTDRVHGVALLAVRRESTRPFGPARVARSLAAAKRAACLIEALKSLDRVASQARSAMDEARVEWVRVLLDHMRSWSRGPGRKDGTRARGRRRSKDSSGGDGDTIARLGAALAERFGLPPRRRALLRQAIEARRVGQTWLEEVLFPCGAFSAADRTALREAQAAHGAAILTELEWPPGVVELLEERQTDANGRSGPPDSPPPVEARIMAALIAYERLATEASREPADSPDAVFAELGRLSGTRLDAEIVSALAALARSNGDARTRSR